MSGISRQFSTALRSCQTRLNWGTITSVMRAGLPTCTLPMRFMVKVWAAETAYDQGEGSQLETLCSRT